MGSKSLVGQSEGSLSCNLRLLAVPKAGAGAKCKGIKVVRGIRSSIACLSVACTAKHCKVQITLLKKAGLKTMESLVDISDSALACNRFIWVGPKEASAVSFPCS